MKCLTWVIKWPCVQRPTSWAGSVTNNHKNIKWSSTHDRAGARPHCTRNTHEQVALRSPLSATAPIPHPTTLAIWGVLYAQIIRGRECKHGSLIGGHKSKTGIAYKTDLFSGGLEEQWERQKPPNWEGCITHIVWKEKWPKSQVWWKMGKYRKPD